MPMLRKAKQNDIPEILEVIRPFVEQQLILKKSREDIQERLRDYFVYDESGTIVACAALYPGWEELGEIRTVAVSQEAQKKGIGKELVLACIEEAQNLGLPKIFVLTSEKEFFAKLGFIEVDKHTLPQKIFKDCIGCPHFLDCDEIAMVMEL
jgi:amino-acid N-acetyltransferase